MSSKDKKFTHTILLTAAGQEELSILKQQQFMENGCICCKVDNLATYYLQATMVSLDPNGPDIDISIPHGFVAAILSGKPGKKIGFLQKQDPQ